MLNYAKAPREISVLRKLECLRVMVQAHTKQAGAQAMLLAFQKNPQGSKYPCDWHL